MAATSRSCDSRSGIVQQAAVHGIQPSASESACAVPAVNGDERCELHWVSVKAQLQLPPAQSLGDRLDEGFY